MTPPEILVVAALVWLQLEEEPLLEIAGSRLDILSFRAREGSDGRHRTNWFSNSTGGPVEHGALEQNTKHLKNTHYPVVSRIF